MTGKNAPSLTDDLRASLFIQNQGIGTSNKEMEFIVGIGSTRKWNLLRKSETWKEGKVRLGYNKVRFRGYGNTLHHCLVLM